MWKPETAGTKAKEREASEEKLCGNHSIFQSNVTPSSALNAF